VYVSIMANHHPLLYIQSPTTLTDSFEQNKTKQSTYQP
jgi:hypothetical protein